MVQVPTAVSFSLRAPNVTGWMENTLFLVSTCGGGLAYQLTDTPCGAAAKINSHGLLALPPWLVPAEVSVQPDTEMDHCGNETFFSQVSFNPDQFLDRCIVLLRKSLRQCRRDRRMSEGIPFFSTVRE